MLEKFYLSYELLYGILYEINESKLATHCGLVVMFFLWLAGSMTLTFVLKTVDVQNLSLLVKQSSLSLLYLTFILKTGFNSFIVSISFIVSCTNPF